MGANQKISSSRDEHGRAPQATCQNTPGAAAGELHPKVSPLTPQLRVDEENPCLAVGCVCSVSFPARQQESFCTQKYLRRNQAPLQPTGVGLFDDHLLLAHMSRKKSMYFGQSKCRTQILKHPNPEQPRSSCQPAE